MDEIMNVSDNSYLQNVASLSHEQLKTLGLESCYRICGFQINFYKCGETLPENFMNEHQIESDWLVSV